MKAIHSAIGLFVVFAVAYVVPMYVDALGLKFYFTSSQLRFAPISEVRVKFVTVAVVAAAIGTLGAVLFRLIPQRLAWLVHGLGFLAIIAASVAMIYRESSWFSPG